MCYCRLLKLYLAFYCIILIGTTLIIQLINMFKNLNMIVCESNRVKYCVEF